MEYTYPMEQMHNLLVVDFEKQYEEVPMEKYTRREFLKSGAIVNLAIVSTAALLSCSNQNSQTQNTTTTPTETQSNQPTLIPVTKPPGCESTVATDRLYSLEHIWVKVETGNLVKLGMTDYMQMMMGQFINIFLPEVGTRVVPDKSFGAIHGYKMSVDLISPISGEIVQVNQEVISEVRALITADPYGAGWIIVVKPDDIKQLDVLISADEYGLRTAKKT